MNRATIAALALMGLGSTHALAAPVIDQNQPGVVGGFCYLAAANLCGQSFQQDHTNIAGAGIYFHPGYIGGPGTVTISIYETYGAIPGGLVASGTSGTVDSNSGWVDVFWSAVGVDLLTTYYMVLESSDPSLVASLYGDAYDSYSNGNALYNGQDPYVTNYDLTFRTYYDEAFGVPGNVPEPAGLALLGLGLAGLAVFRVRRLKPRLGSA